MQNKNYAFYLVCLFSLMLYACSSPGIFGKKTPHQEYEKKMKDAGLKETVLGEAWLREAAITLSNPLDITLFVSCYNEANFIAETLVEAVRAMEVIGKTYEIIIIDDYSKVAKKQNLGGEA